MIRALRTLVGGALGLVAVVAPAWGIYHLLRQPSCGDGGPACPDEVGLWIVAIVVSATIVAPVAIFVAGRLAPLHPPWLLVPILVMSPLCFVAGVVVSLVGPTADPDTRWVGILIGGLTALLLARVAWGLARRARRRRASAPLGATLSTMASLQSTAADAAAAKPAKAADRGGATMATLAGQLAQIAEAKAAAQDDDVAARLRRLDELRAAGLINPDEHAARRREILDEI